MTHFENTARTPSTPAADSARTGPVLIDSRDFKLVAGGSPKGGWLAPASSAVLREAQSPKGGW